MEKYLNHHKYKQKLLMLKHAHYPCIIGRLYYYATLTFTAMTLCRGVPKFAEALIWH